MSRKISENVKELLRKLLEFLDNVEEILRIMFKNFHEIIGKMFRKLQVNYEKIQSNYAQNFRKFLLIINEMLKRKGFNNFEENLINVLKIMFKKYLKIKNFFLEIPEKF